MIDGIKKCECGCGEDVRSPRANYIDGKHYNRHYRKTHKRKPIRVSKPKPSGRPVLDEDKKFLAHWMDEIFRWAECRDAEFTRKDLLDEWASDVEWLIKDQHYRINQILVALSKPQMKRLERRKIRWMLGKAAHYVYKVRKDV